MNIQEGALDVEADATAEQGFLKRPPLFFWEYGQPKVDATAQQAVSEGASENSESSNSGCNCATGIFGGTL